MNTQTPVVPAPVPEAPTTQDVTENVPEMKPEMSTEPTPQANPEMQEERSWSEEIELAGHQLVDKATELLAEGNVRRLILRTPDGQLLLEIPLVAGAVVGGVITLFAPLLAILGAAASVLARVKVEIVRVKEPSSNEPPSNE